MKFSPLIEEAAERWSGKAEAPNKWSRQYRNGVPMYSNKWIENIFARTHPVVPLLWGLPAAGYGLYVGFVDGRVMGSLLLFVVGILLWTLVEYVLHRFPMHRVVKPGEKRLPFFLMHGYHHEFPDDPMRLVAPVMASWTGALIIGGMLYLTIGLWGGSPYWLQIIAGTIFGYVAYDSIHFYTHHAKPKTAVGKFLRRYHMEHHYKDHDSHFGISSPLWDLVFGTFRGKEVTPKKKGSTRETAASHQ
jgi:sterol desaturase/sphingolipid hydroxylase (fatty acid hydroxylase superfamily)